MLRKKDIEAVKKTEKERRDTRDPGAALLKSERRVLGSCHQCQTVNDKYSLSGTGTGTVKTKLRKHWYPPIKIQSK